jgi:hypothetical protein
MPDESVGVVRIDMNAPCPRCHKKGSVNGGMCLRCMLKALRAGEFDHVIQRAKAADVAKGGKSGRP